MPKAAKCPKCSKPVWVADNGTCVECLTPIDQRTAYRAVAQCPTPPKCAPPAKNTLDQADIHTALQAVDEAWNDLVRARSIVPFLDDAAAGSINYSTPPFYQQFGLNPAVVSFERPLSHAEAERIITAGHSINEGHVLRLHAILDAAGLLQEILDKHDAFERRILLIKSLRNEIAHGRRVCMSGDKEQQKLLQEILDLLYGDDLVSGDPRLCAERASITQDMESSNAFLWPLSILGVLLPLTSTVREFIDSFREEGL